MSLTDLVISPLSPALGAEVSGIDLDQALDDSKLETVYKALIEHKVVCFREKALSPQSHMRFAESFGELDKPPPLSDLKYLYVNEGFTVHVVGYTTRESQPRFPRCILTTVPLEPANPDILCQSI